MESYQYPSGTRHPCRLVEWWHRWRFRRWYAMLPAFYRAFYPFENALSLTLKYADHAVRSAHSMDELASTSLRGVVDMERTITELRLALAAAHAGWDEDRVDRFMAMWFKRHDLPTSAVGARS